jgi:hypothetical protein
MKRLMEAHWRMRNSVGSPWMEMRPRTEERLQSADLQQQIRFIEGDGTIRNAARNAGMKPLNEQRPIKRSMSAGSIRIPVTEADIEMHQNDQTKQIYRRTMEADRQAPCKLRETDARMRTLSNSRSLTELDNTQRMARAWVTARDLKFYGKFDKLEEFYQTELDLMCQELGSKHPDTLTLRAELALVKRQPPTTSKKLQESELLFRQVFRDRMELLGPDHKSTLTAMNNLALVLEEQWLAKKANFHEQQVMHKLYEAGHLLQQALDSKRRTLGQRDPDTLSTVRNLLSVMQKTPNQEAEVHKLQRALKTKKVRAVARRSHTP